jgi:hypothetical protein
LLAFSDEWFSDRHESLIFNSNSRAHLFLSSLQVESHLGNSLLTFTFAILFPARKQACGPEARALRGKSIGGKRNPIEDPTVLPQNEAGPSGAPPGAPTSESPCI